MTQNRTYIEAKIKIIPFSFSVMGAYHLIVRSNLQMQFWIQNITKTLLSEMLLEISVDKIALARLIFYLDQKTQKILETGQKKIIILKLMMSIKKKIIICLQS